MARATSNKFRRATPSTLSINRVLVIVNFTDSARTADPMRSICVHLLIDDVNSSQLGEAQ